jgi:hypothetical protein
MATFVEQPLLLFKNRSQRTSKERFIMRVFSPRATQIQGVGPAKKTKKRRNRLTETPRQHHRFSGSEHAIERSRIMFEKRAKNLVSFTP